MCIMVGEVAHMTSQIAPYGSWKSPITSDIIASGGIRLDSPVSIDSGDVYWLEIRPAEGGRSVLVKHCADGTVTDVTPAPFNVRTRVHEYGGGAYLIHNGTVYFSNFSDQRLYKREPGKKPVPITPEADIRYADGVFDRRRKRIICVCEDHTAPDHEAINSLAAMDINGEKPLQTLLSGNDFYSSPRLSGDGTRLCWLAWNHPDMPWDGTELWIADIAPDGSIVKPVKVAGSRNESVTQPRFSPDGTLYFISDRSGWWNLYRWIAGDITCLWETEAEFAEPDWVFGRSNYAFLSSERVICTYSRDGISHLAVIDTATLKRTDIKTPYTALSSLAATKDNIAFLAASPSEAAAVVELDIKSGDANILRRSMNISFDEGYFSVPEPVEFPTENGLTAHALYYAPKNRDYTAPAGEQPPLLVLSHGGPTSQTSSALNLSIQYWTSRGFAVIDVNYGGSSGYGREYRQRLEGKWGIVDVDDCANAAKHFVDRGLADPQRLAIRGGSAGGYTTLAALTFRDVFKAGASYYGVSDLEGLAKETHKFESRYLDGLIGTYPERRDTYLERSPIQHVDRLSCPVIFFQGSEDRVVPPDQAEMMVEALRKKGVPVAYLLFPGEQHGFRQAQNIKRALDAELYFYARMFGFEPAEPVEPVEIYNL